MSAISVFACTFAWILATPPRTEHAHRLPFPWLWQHYWLKISSNATFPRPWKICSFPLSDYGNTSDSCIPPTSRVLMVLKVGLLSLWERTCRKISGAIHGNTATACDGKWWATWGFSRFWGNMMDFLNPDKHTIPSEPTKIWLPLTALWENYILLMLELSPLLNKSPACITDSTPPVETIIISGWTVRRKDATQAFMHPPPPPLGLSLKFTKKFKGFLYA